MKTFSWTSSAILFSIFISFIAQGAPAAQGGSFQLYFNHGTLHANCNWQQGPQLKNESILKIEWTKASNNAAIDPSGNFELALTMPEMPDMPVAPTQLNRVIDQHGNPLLGKYLVRSIYFSMKGTWKLRLNLTNENGHQETQEISLDI